MIDLNKVDGTPANKSEVACIVTEGEDRVGFQWYESHAPFETILLDKEDFVQLARVARRQLGEVVEQYLRQQLNESHTLPKASYDLATAGYDLYRFLVSAPAGKYVLEWIRERHRKNALESIEIHGRLAIPWNVVYDERPALKKQAFFEDCESEDLWEPFWGVRYNLAHGKRVDPLRRKAVLEAPSVTIVIDAVVRACLPAQETQRLDAFLAFLKAHDVSVRVCTSEEVLNDELQKSGRPDLLYWCSHATPTELHLCKTPISSDEAEKVARQSTRDSGVRPISPDELRKLIRRGEEISYGKSRRDSIAFLNACRTVERGEVGSFLDAFADLGFAGIIGTEHQTIDTFANHFGVDFLRAFLVEGEPVGRILQRLRRRIPLGLLYAAYCPPHIRVQTAAEEMLEHSEQADLQIPFQPGQPLSPPASGPSRAAPTPLPAKPYPSLSYYDETHRALFAGRDDDLERFALLLDQPETRVLVLHGKSGVGKSSFLRACFIPFIETECLGYRFMRQRDPTTDDETEESQRPVLFVHATSDPLTELTEALLIFCSTPFSYDTPRGDKSEVDLPGHLRDLLQQEPTRAALREKLGDSPAFLSRLLAELGKRLPFTPILVVDQCEEIFTLVKSDEDRVNAEEFLQALRNIVHQEGDFKVILSLRTEYHGQLVDGLRKELGDVHTVRGIREYLLSDLDVEELADAIRRPTLRRRIPHAPQAPFDKYGFAYESEVPKEIARRVVESTGGRQDSTLPLVQVICARLYETALPRDDKTIKLADLESIGGVAGGLHTHVDELLKQVATEDRDIVKIKKLLSTLYLTQHDGSTTTALQQEDVAAKTWRSLGGARPFEDLLAAAQDKRLIRVATMGTGDKTRYLSLGHDALARITKSWDDEFKYWQRVRRKLLIPSILAVSMAIIAIVTFVLFRREHSAHLDAVRLLAGSRESLDRWLIGLSGELEQYHGMEKTRRRLLQDVVAKVAEEFPDGPKPYERKAYALLLIRQADAYVQLSRLPSIQEDPEERLNYLQKAEAAAASAEDLLVALSRQNDAAIWLQLTNSRIAGGICLTEQLGLATDEQERIQAEAHRSFNGAREALAALAQLGVTGNDYINAAGRRHLAYAAFLEKTAKPDEALDEIGTAEELFRQLPAVRLEYRNYLLKALMERSRLLRHTNRHNDAVEPLRDAINFLQAMIEDDPERLDHLAEQNRIRSTLITCLQKAGEWNDAAKQSRELAAAYETLIDAPSVLTGYRRLASVYDAQSQFAARVGDGSQALAPLHEAISTSDKLLALVGDPLETKKIQEQIVRLRKEMSRLLIEAVLNPRSHDDSLYQQLISYSERSLRDRPSDGNHQAVRTLSLIALGRRQRELRDPNGSTVLQEGLSALRQLVTTGADAGYPDGYPSDFFPELLSRLTASEAAQTESPSNE